MFAALPVSQATCILQQHINPTSDEKMEEFVETLKDRRQEEKLKDVNLDDWLPITSSRTAKWYYSAFHNVTAMVGAGVLGLPFAMSQLGWGLGAVAIVITLYTLWQLVEMHEMVPGKRFDRYHELGQHAFGPRLGLWIILPLQIIVMVGTDIVYMVTGGQSLRKFHDLICHGRTTGSCADIRLTFWIMIFASPHFVLSQLPNFNSISSISGAAAVMSLTYSMIAFVTSAVKGSSTTTSAAAVDYALRATTPAGRSFGMLSALGTVSFAYAAHNVVLEIQATIPSSPETPSKKPMWRGVVVAYAIVALCYFSVAFAGYYAFGSSVEPNVLISLEKPTWLIAAANLMVVVHVVGGYQVFAMPMFDMVETVLVKNLKYKPGFWLRLVSRSAYVAATMFVGLTFPFFDGLLGFFGGFGFAPTTYFIPCIMWLILKKPKKYGLTWFINIICIVIGVLLTLVSSIGGLRQIILDAKNYKLYS